MLEKAMHLCEATFGHLATYDGKQFQTVAIRGVPARFAEFRRENQQVYGAGTGVARLLQGEKFVHFIDVADTDAYRSGDINQRAVVDLGGARSMLVVPLVKDEAMQGFITIYRQEVRPFSDKQIALLQNFAAQAVIAMENARLMNETREALERQTATAEILRVISSSPTDAQPTFDAIARAATTLSGAVLGGVFTFDGSLIHFVADYGWTPDEMAMIRSTFPIPPGRGSVAARAISTRAVAHIEDMSTDPEFAYPSLAQSGGHTVLSVPILRDGNPIGAINVQRRHVELFSDKQIDLLKTFADQAVIAIENVRLFNELSDRTGDLQESLEYQTATSDVLKVISRSTFDLQPVLDTMVETATRLCDAEMANLALREGELLRVAAAFGYSPEYEAWLKAIGPYRPEGRSVGSKAALEGHVVHVHDITTDPNYPSAPITLGKQRTSLGVPLLRRGETIGVFILARQRVEPFTERQIELVRTFADQAVIAIENTRLLTEQREALERQTATTEILRIISSSPTDVQPTFDAIAAKATTLCDAASGGVFRFDGSLIHFVAHYGWTPEELDAIQHVFPLAPGRDSVAGRAILTKAVAHTADLGTDPEFTHPSISATGLRAALSVPMLRDGNAIGTISVTRHDTQPFSEIQIELLKTFADQAVIAIENTRLFNELQDLTADLQESLEYQTATSEVLKVVSRSTFDLPAVLDTLLQTASRLCGNAEGGLAIRQGDAFRYVATVALEPEFDAALRERSLLPGRGSTVGRVAQEGEVVHIPDIAADPEYALPEVRDLGKIRTTLGVPLLRQGETIGVITLAHRHVELFTERQIALVSTFADQAVIAIENTRLLGELRERTGDLEESLEYQTATSDVLKVISRSTFDLKPVLDTLVTTAAQLCGAEMGHIAKRDGDVYRVASTFAFSPEWDVAVRKLTFEPGRGSVVGRAALTREAVQIADLAADPEYAVPGVITIGKMRTGLGVPLLREGEPIGVIYLARQRVEPFSERQIELVRTFADQAVIAIENARLMTETREALEQQTATAEILQVINSSPGDLTPVFEAMLEKALSLCGASLGTLYTYDGELMHVVAMRGAPPECAAHLTSGPHRPGAGALGRLVRAERVVQIHDVAVAEAYRSGNSLARALVDFGKVRTNLALPLHKDGALRGVIAIYRQEVRPFSDKQIALLQNFAEQAVIAIDNARLLNEIRRREAELRVTFDNMGDGVVMFDGELRLVAWNQNFQQILDFPDDFFVEPKIYADYIRYLAGRGEFGAVDPEAELQRYAANAARQSTVERTRPDGRVIEVRHNPVPGGGFVLIYSDVTERKRAEAEIHAARDAAESALRELKAAQASLIHAEKMASLGQLTAGIAHEIKNPLNFVNNFAGLSVELLDDLKAAAAPALAGLDNDSRTEFDEVIDMVTGNLTKIAEHGRRADGIVTSMLAHSRGTSGERQSTDVNALVEESLNLAYHGARAQDQSFNITLERNFDRAIAPIELVPQDMTRVFLNLFGNGFYAANKRRNQAADGGFKPTLTVTTRDLGEAIEIRVRDNGTGIPPEFRDKLFQPFFTTKPTGEGTGLGLSISYDIVTQEHGGTIEVDSELGAFTEFTIRLPRAGAIEIHNLQRE
ncbi:MAG TPA: GAF domain-containing protein [Stellaceae bacterium]|nr:GAF domain-containing protein [Stellaceae bacterium]